MDIAEAKLNARRRFVESILGLANSNMGGACMLSEVVEGPLTTLVTFAMQRTFFEIADGGEKVEYNRIWVDIRVGAPDDVKVEVGGGEVNEVNERGVEEDNEPYGFVM